MPEHDNKPAPGPQASVGRMVHYKSYGTPGGEYPPACRAAIITEVGAWLTVPLSTGGEFVADDGRRYRTIEQVRDDTACALMVANPGGLFLNPERPSAHDPNTCADAAAGAWHWPDRV